MANCSSNEFFSPFAWTLSDVVEDNYYEIPIYQRPYSWSDDEVKCLLDDLFYAYKNRDTVGVFYTGELLLRDQGKGVNGQKYKYEVVDGQQRLTTFAMILLSILSIALKRGYKTDDKDIADLRSYLWKYTRSPKKFHKEARLITLSSIDKDLFINIFDAAYDNPNQLMKTVSNYKCKCKTEENIINMLTVIYNRINSEIPFNSKNKETIIEFLEFLLEKTQFIAIQSSVEMKQVFSVFESLNSKGKTLAEIDKIKTYIFSELDSGDYSTYSTRWGQLIIKTDDCLGDYLQVFVRAYLEYYTYDIKLKNFKKLTRDILPDKFGVSDKATALKLLIDKMLEKADIFVLLHNKEKLFKQINNSKFKTFYTIYCCMGYEHPEALFFRALCEYFESESRTRVASITTIVKSATLFMLKVQSIKGGDSKDVIKYFKNITERYYDESVLNADEISRHFNDSLISEGVDNAIIKSIFATMEFYSKHDLAYCILSLLESIDESNNNKIIFSQAYRMLSQIKETTYHIDHMLVQTPDKNDDKYKYYCDNSSGEEVLVLKEGHDFPADIVISGMKYSEFKNRTLHRLGNIRLYIPEQNQSEGNRKSTDKLPEHEDFTTFKQIIERSNKLADLLLNSPDLR